jgi:hypothetical protein
VMQPERGVGQQDPGTGPQFQAGCGDHVAEVYRAGGR